MIKSIDSILNILKNESFGLHVFMNENNQFSYYLIHLIKTKSTYKIIGDQIIIDATKVNGIIKKHSIISIFVSGNGILLKKVNTKIDDLNQTFKQIFGNIDMNNFYVQTNRISENNWIGIVRKDLIEKALSPIISLEFFLLNIEFLPPTFNNYGPDYSSLKHLHFGKQKLFYSGSLESIEIDEDYSDIIINNNNISNDFLPAFYIATQNSVEHKNDELNEKYSNSNEFKSFRYQQYLKAASILLLIVLLSINYFLYSKYYAKVNFQNELLSVNTTTIDQITKLTEISENKRKFIEKEGILNKTNHCFLINTIAKCTPNSIVLTRIDVFPIIIKSGNISLERKLIRINGNSNNGIGVSEFIQNIKKLKTVKSVNIEFFKKMDDDDKYSEFQLNIEIQKGGGQYE